MYGGTISAPIWHDYMSKVLEGKSNEEFPTTQEQPKWNYDKEWNFSGYDSNSYGY